MTGNTPLSRRGAGILLHPTSLPGPYGIGDVGPAARGWVDTLVEARQTLWQILPLGPTGYGDSPYQCFSAFAGNPYLICPDLLIEDGLLSVKDVAHLDFSAERVEFGRVIPFKLALLEKAWHKFHSTKSSKLKAEFEAFSEARSVWLDDFAMFMALKSAHNGASWNAWDVELRTREKAALASARAKLKDLIGWHKFQQFLFFRQWSSVKAYAREKGISLIGDAPIFVSADSADVWANPELFQLDAECRPRSVAGVPPDYFSVTGQLWGNPLYDWKAIQRSEYAWWIERIRTTLAEVDIVRLDHFRGFEAYWKIPAGMPTAEVGQWSKGPGKALFSALESALGKELPIIAENLGVITPEVETLREAYGFPGMRVLHFAFGDSAGNSFLPHNYETRNTVVYTGTHDNDTTRGWYTSLAEQQRDRVRRYLGRDGHDIAWDLIRLAWSSVANMAIAPLQDILDLGSEARMNTPGTAYGNWSWRLQNGRLSPFALDRLADLTEMYAR